MFETHVEALMESFFCSDPNLLEWRFVTQRFSREWFYIEQHYIEADSQDVAKRMLMIDDINEFKALMRAKTKNTWVQAVFLVTPKSINGSKGWSVDLLLEMREFEPDPEFVNRYYSYEVDGPPQHYYSNELDGHWENLESTMIYKDDSCSLENIQSHWALSEDQSTRAELIILAGIELCGGNYVEGVKWVTSRVRGLGERRPLEMLLPEEFCQVIDFIGRLEQGSGF